MVWEPFIIRYKDGNRTQYTGLCVDLLEYIARDLNFTYVISEPPDLSWGHRLPNGTWVGMTAMLKRKEVDLALAGMSVTSERATVSDYSEGFYFDELALLVSRPTEEIGWTFFLRPFHWLVYIALGGSLIFVTAVFVFLERLGDQANMRKDQGNMRRDQGNMRRDQGNMRGDQGNIRRDQANMRGDQGNIRRDQANMRGDQGNMRGDQGNIRRDQANMRRDQANMCMDEGNMGRDQANMRRDQANTWMDDGNMRMDQPHMWMDQGNIKRDQGNIKRDQGNTRRDKEGGVWHGRQPPSVVDSVLGAVETLFGALLGRAVIYKWRQTPGGRILLSSWILVSLVTVTTYTANLTAFSVVTRQRVPFNTLRQLVKRDDYRWGFLSGTMLESILPHSSNEDYTSFYRGAVSFAESDPSVLSPDVDVQMAQVNSGQYVFLGTLSIYHHYKSRYCQLTVVSERIEDAIELGLVDYWSRKRFPNNYRCAGEEKAEVMSLSLEHVQSAFLVAGMGLVAAALVFGLECLRVATFLVMALVVMCPARVLTSSSVPGPDTVYFQHDFGITTQPNADINRCSVCVRFADTALMVLLNIIVNVGVIGSCEDLCDMLPQPHPQGDVCNKLCGTVGIGDFVKSVVKANSNSIYFCELLGTCPVNDEGDAQISGLTVSPEDGPQGPRKIRFTVESKNGIGTGQLVLSVSTVDGIPNASAFPSSQTFTLNASPAPNCDPDKQTCEKWLPGKYTLSVDICNGECGSSEPHSAPYDHKQTTFTITEH
ncbi:hypothetical protein BaRGS_00003864 [Batillaria attramentaria]|uniref:Ionotropic glutamate receptor n=1 Tax=Batillaria attramentaria TaxID=370345 RepID=A0ABD0LZF7_9CAEN